MKTLPSESSDIQITEKEAMLKKAVQSALAAVGYEIRRRRDEFSTVVGYDLEDEARKAVKVIRAHTMTTYSRLVTLYQQVVYCEKNNLPGCFVECGVWKGGSMGLMAMANQKYGVQRRPLHLFDSFQGICEPDGSIDGKRAIAEVKAVGGQVTGRLKPVKGLYDKLGGYGNLEINRELLENKISYDRNYIHYHVGWFQNTIPKVAHELGEIAILRLDGDWYASTKVCLNYLYPHVVKGGFIIIDDYGWYEGCKRAVDEYLVQAEIHAYLNHVDMSCRYWIKP